MKHISANLRRIRELKNLKQQYVADELGISVKSYARIEKGDCKITIERLSKIAEIIETELVEILYFHGKEKSGSSSNQEPEQTNLIVLYERLVASKDSELKALESQINFLKEELDQRSKSDTSENPFSQN